MNQKNSLLTVLFLASLFSLTGTNQAFGQDLVKEDYGTSNVKWRVGSDVLGLLRSHQGINTLVSRENNNRIAGLSLDLYFNLLDDHHFTENMLFRHGTNFQLGFQQKYIRNSTPNKKSKMYVGFEIAYSHTTYQSKSKLCYFDGKYENDSNKCTGTSVPGIIFNKSRLKQMVIFGKRYPMTKNMILDLGMACGFSYYWGKTIFDEWSSRNSSGGGTFFGLPFSFGKPLSNSLGNGLEKLWNHTLLKPEESGTALFIQFRLVVEFQVNSRTSGNSDL
jgi:hypothetical protein